MRESDKIQEHQKERAYLSAELEEATKELARLDLLNLTLTREKKQVLTAFHFIKVMHEKIEKAFTTDNLYLNVVRILTSELFMDSAALIKINVETRDIALLTSVGLPKNVNGLKLDKNISKQQLLNPTFVNSKSSLRSFHKFIRKGFKYPYFVWYPIVDEERGILVLFVGNKVEDMVSKHPFSEVSLETLRAISSVILLRRDNIACTQEMLEKKEQRIYFLAEMLESSPISVIATDEDAKITYCNPAAEKLYAYKPEELMGKDPGMLNAESNAAEIQREILDTIRQGKVWRGEILNRKKNGDLFYIRASIYKLLDNKGNFIALVGFHEDITERKRVEEILKESEDKYRTIFENTGTATIIIEEDTTISLANREFEKLTGYSKEEVEGKKSWTEFILKDDLERLKGYHDTRRIHPNGAPRNHELKIIGKHGNLRNLFLTVGMIPGTKKSVASSLDITDRKRAEEAIKRRNMELSVLNSIACTVSQTLEIDSILDETLKKLLELMSIDMPAIHLVSEPKWRLASGTNCGISDPLRQMIERISLGHPALKPVLEEGTPITLSKLPTINGWNGYECNGCFALIPVMSKKIVRGILMVYSRTKSTFCPDEVELLTTIGHQIGIAIDNAWLYQELKKQVVFSSTLIDTMPDGMGVLDERGRLEFGNQRLFQMLGYSSEEILGAHWTSLVHPDDHSLVKAQGKSRQEAQSTTYECRLLHKNRTPIPVINSWAPRFDDEGQYKGTMGIVVDITQHKQTEKRLREYEARYSHLLDHMTDGVALTRRGRIIRVNPHMAQMFGFPSAERMEGLRIWDLAALGSKKIMRQQSSPRALGLQGKNRFEFQALRKDRSPFPAECTLTIDQSDPHTFNLAIIRDVTERKVYEEQRKLLSERIMTIQERERASIARELHDELGQALTGIKMDMAWIKSHMKGADEAVSDRFEALGNLVDTTLGSVREMAASLRPSMLDRLGLSAAIEWYAGEFERRTGIECIIESESADFNINSNVAINVYRIFQEALTNIARHAGASRVEVVMAQDREYFTISISDNGRGIPSQELSGPMSLGIAGMRERAELIMGRLDIQSRMGKGTRVTVYLPNSP